MKPKPIVCLAVVLSVWIFTACSQNSYWTTTGVEDPRRPRLPSYVPHRVAVMPFDGHERMVRYAAERFSSGLHPMGFDVVGKNQLKKVMGGAYNVASDEFDAATRIKLNSQLGVDAIFVGRINGKIGVSRIVTFMDVMLLDIKTGEPIWVGRTSTSKYSLARPDPGKSVDATVKKSLKLLRSDLKKQVKAEDKAHRNKLKAEKKAAEEKEAESQAQE